MLSDEVEFYHGEDESGIDWPLDGTILSDKDRKWMSFKDSKIRY